MHNSGNDTVYIAGKAQMARHPEMCRIGVCSGTPILKEGWNLFSAMQGELANDIYASLIQFLNETQASKYDSETDAWMIPLVDLNERMILEAQKLHRGNPSKSTMKYSKYC